jgi:flagellar biosynthesis regulator FlaF
MSGALTLTWMLAMTVGEHELLVQLQGRLLAQEMFMRAMLTAAFMNTSEPATAVDEMRFAQRRISAVALRPTGKYEDKVWETAAEAFESELNQVATRIKGQLAALAIAASREDLDSSLNKEIEAWRERVLYEA